MTSERQRNTIDSPCPSSLLDAEAEMHRIICDPASSHWLRQAIRECLRRDALDALNDATTLRNVFDLRLNALLGTKGHPRKLE